LDSRIALHCAIQTTLKNIKTHVWSMKRTLRSFQRWFKHRLIQKSLSTFKKLTSFGQKKKKIT